LTRGKPARGHGRSTSLQISPRRNDSYDDSYRKGMPDASMMIKWQEC
jgi:hypothetical protein